MPFIVPIVYEGKEFGKLKIDYEVNTDRKYRTYKKRYLAPAIFAQLILLRDFLKEDIELAIKMEDKLLKPRKRYLMLLNLFFPIQEEIHRQAMLYFVRDDYLFETIKSEGIRALRHMFTQLLLELWLSDKNIAGTQINRLRNALIEYTGTREKLQKAGRPRIEIINKLGKDWIRYMYKDIAGILKLAKSHDLKDIDAACEMYISSLKEKYKTSPDSLQLSDNIERLSQGFEAYKRAGLTNPISECIESDLDLKAEFERFKWEPNKFAKEITAKLLGISLGTMVSILYRK